VVPPLAARVAL
jgi:hypothetical protein